MLDRTARSLRLSRLYPGTRYLICVLALGNWAASSHRRETTLQAESRLATRRPTENRDSNATLQQQQHSRSGSSGDSASALEIFGDAMLPLLVDSPTSKCAEVITLGAPDMHIGGLGLPDTAGGTSSIQSILTRRLGLIVGCCMGFIVFIVLVSILGYLKVKKQRQAIKRDQQLPAPEYISYRHFSIQSGEAGAHGGHPHFITSMNTTTLN